ncbi:MAG: 50S ribosomal protein L11 methyltransferase [Desulfobacula sp.]|uniref:50S ribosomal protein L11 methyltransferase n=1 Tax=Desulfobacula sp. TaxID=2593537 RepID=UPI0025BB8D9E|nr:50S ribosomal protein L11 methyltransferase [Desulfobacula sp.]MCD4722527.1 50S ribosomal protein L11 methyltransferase [Desulfobacula sp.]
MIPPDIKMDMKMAMKADKEDVLNILFQSDVKLTAQAFIKAIKAQFSISIFEAKKILQQLIDEQELSYHYLYGSTYVEKSFLRPVSITKNFILTPPGFQARPDKNEIGQNDIDQHSIDSNNIELIIEQGISFGSGQHPTTQLCLAAIDFCFFEKQMMDSKTSLPGADIGTGSGVLAMAMCLAGLTSCNAHEIDPVSINEAKKNVALNHLTKRIKVIEDYMKESKNAFSIISANLRFPTLTTLSDMIYASLIENGSAIISGVREWEKDQLVTLYSEKGFELIWQQDEKKWSGFVLVKKVW